MSKENRKTSHGADYDREATKFTVWCPTAEKVLLHLYKDGHTNSLISSHSLHHTDGQWQVVLNGDWAGHYYTFQTFIDGEARRETVDPYARAVGVNGQRAMVVDLAATDPPGWSEDRAPALESATDAIIYEVHVRDFSIHPGSGMVQKGKFLAFCERGTKNNGVSTGIDHLTALGITHVQLMPVFDFYSVDETGESGYEYNWGYDPLNYNVPEGSYSTDPYNGEVRIREFKQMIMSLHDQGIGVVMDVVYNHTGLTETSHFNLLCPGYYHRKNENGGFTNASGCGNETASENPMMRQFMIDSIVYWMQEYHIDGFRFDLMGIHDLETMRQIAQKAKEINPSVLLYGEGWTAEESPLALKKRAVKKNIHQLPGIGVFCDEIRDGLKGHWANDADRGFVSGNERYKESVKYGITAAIAHPAIRYDQVNYSSAPRALSPAQTINYASCHDNLTLWDKLKIATNAPPEKLTNMALMANTIVLTSQGVPLLHAGVELLRSKNGDGNSYQSPDLINQINWPEKANYPEVFEYYSALISLRKAHPVFRLKSAEDVVSRLFFEETSAAVLSYNLCGKGLDGETWDWVKLVFNATKNKIEIQLSNEEWYIALLNGQFFPGVASQRITLDPWSSLIVYQASKA